MTNYLDPTKEVFAKLREMDRPGPIHMLNLVKLRDLAAYPDGRVSTGADAYRAYAQESGPVFRKLSGRQVWIGKPELMPIGPQDCEQWDIAFIAEYPSVQPSSTCCATPPIARRSSTARFRPPQCPPSPPGPASGCGGLASSTTSVDSAR